MGSRCLMLCRSENFLRTARMKDNRNQLGFCGRRRIARDAVQAARRLMERFSGLVGFGGLVIDPKLIHALDDIYERWPRMAMWRSRSVGLKRHLDHRHRGVLPVDLFLHVIGSK